MEKWLVECVAVADALMRCGRECGKECGRECGSKCGRGVFVALGTGANQDAFGRDGFTAAVWRGRLGGGAALVTGCVFLCMGQGL